MRCLHLLHSSQRDLTEVRGMSEELFLFDYLRRDESGRAGHRVATVAARRGNRLEAFLERLAHSDACHRKAVTEALAHRDDIRNDTPVFHAQPLAGAAPAREHLIGHEEEFPFVAEFAEFGEKIVRWHHRSAPALNRLKHKTRDGADRALLEVLLV